MSEENDNKPNLDVPEHLEYSDEHVWVDASTEPAMVGITEYAADQLGELVYIDLPEVGTADDPSIVTGDPYGEGWIFKIELEDDEPGLLSSEEYANIVAQ